MRQPRRFRPLVQRLEDRRVPAITFTEIPLPSQARSIVAGPDGNLWYTSDTTTSIGRVAPDGQVTEFPTGLDDGERLGEIAVGPDGNVWFLTSHTNCVRITPAGDITIFSLPAKHIVAGPDGNLWFTANFMKLNQMSAMRLIGRRSTDGDITYFEIPDGLDPESIVAGPDGALWFGTMNANRIGRITTDGTILSYPVPKPSGDPTAHIWASSIAVGPDGNLWFTRMGGVGRITPNGDVTVTEVPGLSGDGGITAGPDGNLWFFGRGSRKVYWATTDGRVQTASLTLPGQFLSDLEVGPDGKLWASVIGASSLVRIDPGGADLAISVDASPATIGDALTIVYTVTNLGPTTATSVELAGAGQGGFQAIAESWSSQGPAPTVSVGPGGYDLHAGLGTIAPGATAVVTIVVRPASVGPVVVRGAITHGEPDPSPSNDATEASVVVAPAPIPVPLDTTPPRLMGVTTLRAGRRGKGKVTGYALTFSEAIRPEHLGDPGLIRVAEAKVSRQGRIRPGRAIRAASARPAGPNNTVTIALRARRGLPDGAMITVAGDLADLAGNRLAGDGVRAGTVARIRAV